MVSCWSPVWLWTQINDRLILHVRYQQIDKWLFLKSEATWAVLMLDKIVQVFFFLKLKRQLVFTYNNAPVRKTKSLFVSPSFWISPWCLRTCGQLSVAAVPSFGPRSCVFRVRVATAPPVLPSSGFSPPKGTEQSRQTRWKVRYLLLKRQP